MATPVNVWGVNESMGPPRRTRSDAEKQEVWAAAGSLAAAVFLVVLNVISYLVSLPFWPATNPWDDTRIAITTIVGCVAMLALAVAIVIIKVRVTVPVMAARSTNE